MKWIEFETPGLYAFLKSSVLMKWVGGIRVQYTPEQDLYDLIYINETAGYIWETSFRTLEEAISTAEQNY